MVREPREGSLAGSLAGAGAGEPATRGPHSRPAVRAHVDAVPTFLRLRLHHQSLAPRTDPIFLGPWRPRSGRPPRPSPCGPRAGAADVADGGQASGAAWDGNSVEPPSLPLTGWKQQRQPGPQLFHLL